MPDPPSRTVYLPSPSKETLKFRHWWPVGEEPDSVPNDAPVVLLVHSLSGRSSWMTPMVKRLIDGVEVDPGVVPLARIQQPDIDLSNLDDLQGTLACFGDTGIGGGLALLLLTPVGAFVVGAFAHSRFTAL